MSLSECTTSIGLEQSLIRTWARNIVNISLTSSANWSQYTACTSLTSPLLLTPDAPRTPPLYGGTVNSEETRLSARQLASAVGSHPTSTSDGNGGIRFSWLFLACVFGGIGSMLPIICFSCISGVRTRYYQGTAFLLDGRCISAAVIFVLVAIAVALGEGATAVRRACCHCC